MSLNGLVTIVLTVMATWVPVSTHHYYEPTETTVKRYVAIATDIVEIVEADEGERIENVRMEALLLASIASYESFFHADVDRCKRGLGGAWSVFQIAGGGKRSKKRICMDRKEAVRVALEMVRESFRECERLPFLDRLSFYTDGRCNKNWERSRLRVKRAMNFETAHDSTAS